MKLFKNKKIIKYLLVGFTAFFVDYFLFILLNKFTGLPIFFSNSAALVVGFLISFFGNRLYVFAADEENTMKHSLKKQLLLYVILLTINTFLTYLIIAGLEHLGVDVAIGKVVSMAFIIIWNYVLYKKIIFKYS